mmetsp:Transcript_18282/g.42650  ORF Transcript_18282/g.42650 Transcript_18282/m.42650 type:complete len:82 (-) Transcript_18282:792-1037(-)
MRATLRTGVCCARGLAPKCATVGTLVCNMGDAAGIAPTTGIPAHLTSVSTVAEVAIIGFTATAGSAAPVLNIRKSTAGVAG